MKQKLVLKAVVSIIVIFWGLAAWIIFRVVLGHNIRMPDAEYATYSPDGQFIAMVDRFPELHPSVTIRNADNGNVITSFSNSTGQPTVVFNADGQLIAMPGRRSIEFWVTETWSLIQEVDLDNWVDGIGYASNENIWIVNTSGADGVEVFSINPMNDFAVQQIVSFSYRQGGRLALSNSLNNVAIVAHSYPNTRIFIVNLQSGEVEQTMTSGSYILDLVWTRDDRNLIGAGDDGIIYVWSTESSEEIVRIEQDDTVRSVDVSPDGQFLAAGGEQATTIYLTGSWEEIARIGPTNVVESIRFNPIDNNYLVVSTRSLDNSLWRWGTRVIDISNVTDQ